MDIAIRRRPKRGKRHILGLELRRTLITSIFHFANLKLPQ